MNEEQKKEGTEDEAPEPMEEKELIKRVQVILYASGRAMSLEELSSMTKEPSARNIRKAVSELKKQMEERDSPITLVEEKKDHWKFMIRDDYLKYVADLIPSMDLDKATLETLAVIAWRNPILQADVIKIRTSNAYEHIAKLVDMGFISKEKYGRSFVLKPTSKFFEYFDLPSKEYIKDLFKNVADGVRVIDEKEEDQKQVEEFDEKLGKMPVYETKQEGTEEKEEEPEMRLGKLEVYEEEEKEEEPEGLEIRERREVEFDDIGGEKEEKKGKAETPEKKAEEEKPEEKKEEDKAMKVIEDIASIGEEPEQPEQEPKSPEEETEEPEKPEEPEEKEDEERKLTPALEDFASNEEEKEEEPGSEGIPEEEKGPKEPEEKDKEKGKEDAGAKEDDDSQMS